MAEIISFGNNNQKDTFFKSIFIQVKLAWEEFLRLSLFTKLTIIFVVLILIFTFRASGEILQYINYATSNKPEVSTSLPANCHLAVDLSACGKNTSCNPSPIAVCDKIQNQ